MDMEHQLQQLLHFSPGQEHFMAASPAGFFAVDGGGGGHPAHFQIGGGFVEPAGVVAPGIDDGGWVVEIEDLIMQQLGDELFGGADVISVGGAGDHHHHQPWQCDDDNGGSPEGPPPSVSLDGDGGSPPPSGEQAGAGELEHHEDGDDASPAGGARKRRDRSKTIVSERKRRVRMKEKLYELRSLVPNITKMDKASIIADAVEYVKNLQAHARALKEEVAALEAQPRSPAGAGHEQQNQQQHVGRAAAAGRRQQDRAGDSGGRRGGHGARVTCVGAARVGEGRFFVTVECEKKDGVAAPLCAAVESLACRVESSSLVRSGPDRVVSTFTLKTLVILSLGPAASTAAAAAARRLPGDAHEPPPPVLLRELPVPGPLPHAAPPQPGLPDPHGRLLLAPDPAHGRRRNRPSGPRRSLPSSPRLLGLPPAAAAASAAAAYKAAAAAAAVANSGGVDLTPAVRRNKKRKLPEKQLSDRVAALLPESALYMELLEFEARVDAALTRKKVDI
ncbi:hypothetical protein BAE44_0021840 [Dichanthelium oligosanthes]|uniref:BHLH domain-containing protein n=1 Tax=Dichanthelium oligosanthes TaxID=888268 RepID=A0A1E5UWA9_9POAL|nr:hypothetical protein BAE44_0021840 [Dichanthelium oligosanthes]